MWGGLDPFPMVLLPPVAQSRGTPSLLVSMTNRVSGSQEQAPLPVLHTLFHLNSLCYALGNRDLREPEQVAHITQKSETGLTACLPAPQPPYPWLPFLCLLSLTSLLYSLSLPPWFLCTQIPVKDSSMALKTTVVSTLPPGSLCKDADDFSICEPPTVWLILCVCVHRGFKLCLLSQDSVQSHRR